MTRKDHAHIILALKAAAKIIARLDQSLTDNGMGYNLSSVPGYEGQDFIGYVECLITKATGEEFTALPHWPSLLKK